MQLEGKVAIVTGAGQGIGRATALALAREGADVVVNDIYLDRAKAVADEIRSIGRKAEPVKADVSNSEEVNQIVKRTMDVFGGIHILVNNAAVGDIVLALAMTEAQWDNMIKVNLKGPFLCSRAVAKHMVEQKQGKIVNIVSVAGLIGRPGQSAYGAAKGGLIQLTRVLAMEWAKYNINVNAVSPGMTMTPHLLEKTAKEHPGLIADFLDRIPLRRANKPEDIANAVLFLASPQSDNITGQTIVVDGGITALHPGYKEPKE